MALNFVLGRRVGHPQALQQQRALPRLQMLLPLQPQVRRRLLKPTTTISTIKSVVWFGLRHRSSLVG